MLHHIITTTLRIMDAMNTDEYNAAHELLLIYLILLSCCDYYPFRVLMSFDRNLPRMPLLLKHGVKRQDSKKNVKIL